ncbi:flagellar associated repeat protein [Brevibacillus sp. AG162]|uniref:SwmB domain-containing protein n=1 Tax=Brevibacillus sp. AG162 TaxID=2572910 RepID=UPI00115275E7|nr:SwmB domain-containing protein [Brevibacillus sp. AG162]TQK63043.1 flagellar associated repeat protein [Brevibacillus sp. AG162]
MNKKVALSILSATVVASMASSAFAAPKSGVYLGGDVDRYYELRDLFNLTDAGNKKFAADMAATSFDKLIYVDFDGKGASLREIMNGEFSKVKRDLKETDFEGVYTKSNLDGSNGATYDPRKDAVPGPAGELKVEAVDALNANEIVVDFDDELDTVTAEDASNYELKVNNQAGPAFTVKVDSVDKTKAVITLTNANIKTGDYVSLTVKKTVLNKNLSGLEKDETKTFSFVDTAAPVIKSVQVKGNDVVVSFDEYVGSIGLITIDNKNVNVPSTNPAVKEITLTGAATGLTAGQHTIAFANVKDLQATPNNAPYLTKTFDVTVDAAAPSVSKVEAAGEYKFKVVFDKEVTKPTTISVKKNGYAVNADIQPVAGTNDDEYYVTVADNGQVKVYGDNETTTNLSVTVGGYKATNNNMFGNEFTTSVTLSKDGAAPTIVNRFSKVVNKGTTELPNEVFHVQFSEELIDAVGAVDTTKIVLKDKDGVRKTVESAQVVTDASGKKTILEVASNDVKANGAINAGTYTIDFGTGAVKDLSQNPNAAASVSIVKSGAVTGEIDLNNKVTVADNKITIDFGREMSAAATSLSNYQFNGAPIKATSIYFKDTKEKVVIELQDETIPSSGKAVLTIADSVVAVDGSKLNAASKNLVVGEFTDNVDPVLVSAKKESSTALVLTFSENVAVDTTADYLDDFVVKVNGTTVTPEAIAGGTDKKTVTLTLPTYNTAQTVTVATYKSDLNTKDEAGNTLKVNTTPITAN